MGHRLYFSVMSSVHYAQYGMFACKTKHLFINSSLEMNTHCATGRVACPLKILECMTFARLIMALKQQHNIVNLKIFKCYFTEYIEPKKYLLDSISIVKSKVV